MGYEFPTYRPDTDMFDTSLDWMYARRIPTDILRSLNAYETKNTPAATPHHDNAEQPNYVPVVKHIKRNKNNPVAQAVPSNSQVEEKVDAPKATAAKKVKKYPLQVFDPIYFYGRTDGGGAGKSKPTPHTGGQCAISTSHTIAQTKAPTKTKDKTPQPQEQPTSERVRIPLKPNLWDYFPHLCNLVDLGPIGRNYEKFSEFKIKMSKVVYGTLFSGASILKETMDENEWQFVPQNFTDAKGLVIQYAQVLCDICRQMFHLTESGWLNQKSFDVWRDYEKDNPHNKKKNEYYLAAGISAVGALGKGVNLRTAGAPILGGTKYAFEVSNWVRHVGTAVGIGSSVANVINNHLDDNNDISLTSLPKGVDLFDTDTYYDSITRKVLPDWVPESYHDFEKMKLKVGMFALKVGTFAGWATSGVNAAMNLYAAHEEGKNADAHQRRATKALEQLSNDNRKIHVAIMNTLEQYCSLSMSDDMILDFMSLISFVTQMDVYKTVNNML